MRKKFLNIVILFLFLFGFANTSFAQDFKIKNIISDDSSTLILINGNINSKDVIMTSGKVVTPPRAYIDIHDAVLMGSPKQTVLLKNSGITEIRIAQFSANPNVVRMVIYAKTPEAISKIKLIKTNNSIALKLCDFKKAKDLNLKNSYAAIYKDEFTEKISFDFDDIPRRVIAVKTLPPKKIYIQSQPEKTTIGVQPKNQKYIITSICKKNDQIFITGAGSLKLSRSLILENPDRVVFDLPNAMVQNKETLGEFILNSTDKINIEPFNNNVIRAVVTTKNPEKYKAVISPDLQSLIIGQESQLDYSAFPNSSLLAKIKKIDVKKENEKTTRITITIDKPVIHSINQTLDRIIFDLYNVNFPDKTLLSGLTSTNQFRGLELDKISCRQNGVSLSIPIRKNLDIETGISLDGEKLYIKLSDNKKVTDVKYVIIGRNRKIILDPGHGGKDVGAINGLVYEKNITLDVSKRVEKYLKESGMNVVMTRSIDEFISLQRRVEITNAQSPDVFVSIHVNSSEGPVATGLETHWFTTPSMEFAQVVQKHLASNITSPDRGICKSMFYVIHHSLMPAILVEIGFISNNKEKDQILSPQRQDDTARSISNGIILYLAKDYARKNGSRGKI
ncbi:MAG: N-acetylmuramoyl-L-alanine amidase [Candidatus Gastranaerophilaceae bacterium]|jgi:N-acetylmuramoyl-L-alanine amidase